jgi:hypothetical protein
MVGMGAVVLLFETVAKTSPVPLYTAIKWAPKEPPKAKKRSEGRQERNQVRSGVVLGSCLGSIGTCRYVPSFFKALSGVSAFLGVRARGHFKNTRKRITKKTGATNYEGPPKQIDEHPPPVYLLNPRSTHPPADFFFLGIFLVRFRAFLGKGSSKTPYEKLKYFCKKSMSITFSKKIDKNFDVSLSSTLFVLSRFRVFLSDGSSKTLQKTFCKKNRVEKFLQKKSTKNPKPIFFDLFYHVLGRFSVRGVKKHHKRISKKITLTLVLFWPLTHPPTTQGSPVFFGRPLDKLPAYPTPSLFVFVFCTNSAS